MKPVRLERLLAGVPHRVAKGDGNTAVGSLSYDSRECAGGCLFFCIAGFNVDGHDFVPEAVARGAKAIVAERDVAVPEGVTLALVEDSRRAMGLISAEFFGNPSRKLDVTGVTGTNGKTSVAFMVEAALRRAGRRTALMGTVENRIGGEVLPVKRTTPESLDTQSLMARMVESGCTHLSMEVSSHAVELHRIAGCRFSTGIFTNLTQDHLDFHRDFDSYREAKRRFFSEYLTAGGQAAVLNADDPGAAYVARGLECRVVTYGIESGGADVRAEGVACGASGIRFEVTGGGSRLGVIESGLLGRFNVYNALALAAFAFARGIPFEAVAGVLADMPPVPGRFERIDAGQDFTVVVDYAHTPDGLENVLRSAREMCAGRLIVVFGAGGDRDRTKRPKMGAAAAALADVVIVTSDNPRSEDPGAIIRDVLAGMGAGREPVVEPDRFNAIREALRTAGGGDVVVIAGKGHETYQIFRDRTVYFDDRELARSILTRMVQPELFTPFE
ncbi:MAG: UDP-N-acetylmuramoyl-L-alanyl-D-glutamate--2,6-diaminopimelate ligase [bacterium]